MNSTKKLLEIFVIPDSNGYKDVIFRVIWAIDFEDGGFVSTAGFETFLPVDNIQNFIPANQVGTARLLQWVYDVQGGDVFLEQIKAFHADRILYEKANAGTQRYFEGFDVPAAPSNTVTTVGAQTL
jgi:hypothetical protein